MSTSTHNQAVTATRPYALFQLMRPLQWLKNCFVFTGFIFGEEYSNLSLLFCVSIAALAFSLISSSVYIINDIIDCEQDKNHPKKRFRPLPSNKISIFQALIMFLCLSTSGFCLGFIVSQKVLVILVLYLIMNLFYSFRLKHEVLIDVFCISTGFMLRILTGTIGIGIPPSKWLLLCGLMVTLFLGFAKRRAEIVALAENKKEHRKVLVNYNATFLDMILSICSTGVIISYSLYTMSPQTIKIHHTEGLIYTVPFVVYGLFRFIYMIHHQEAGGDPTTDLIKDPHIILTISGWAAMIGYIFYYR